MVLGQDCYAINMIKYFRQSQTTNLTFDMPKKYLEKEIFELSNQFHGVKRQLQPLQFIKQLFSNYLIYQIRLPA